MADTAASSQDTNSIRHAPIGAVGLIIGALTVVAMVINVLAWLVGGSHATAGLVFFLAVTPAGLGTLLAIVSLIRGEKARVYAHYALWLNGLVLVLAVPLAMAWTLYFNR